MNPSKPIEMAHTPDLMGSWVALQRAARRARLIAAQTGTAIVVERNGVIEHVYPELENLQGTQRQRLTAASPSTGAFSEAD